MSAEITTSNEISLSQSDISEWRIDMFVLVLSSDSETSNYANENVTLQSVSISKSLL